MAVLAYLRQELNQGGTFIPEWRALDEASKLGAEHCYRFFGYFRLQDYCLPV